jgi:hypothetical protein
MTGTRSGSELYRVTGLERFPRRYIKSFFRNKVYDPEWKNIEAFPGFKKRFGEFAAF